MSRSPGPLQWRHNKRDGVSNHRRLDCLLNRLFGRRSKKTSKLRVTGLCEGNSPVTGEFLAQRASNAENVSIRWCHHVWFRVERDAAYCTHTHAARTHAHYDKHPKTDLEYSGIIWFDLEWYHLYYIIESFKLLKTFKTQALKRYCWVNKDLHQQCSLSLVVNSGTTDLASILGTNGLVKQ